MLTMDGGDQGEARVGAGETQPFKRMASRKSWARAASEAPWRSGPLISSSGAAKRHGRSEPAAVRRRRLQVGQ